MKRALLALLAVAFLSTGMMFATYEENKTEKSSCGCCKKESKGIKKQHKCCPEKKCCKKEKKPVVKKECGCKKDCGCKKCCSKKTRCDGLSDCCKKTSCCKTCSKCCKKGETTAEVVK